MIAVYVFPNNPSNTNLCVLQSVNVPVVPNLYLQKVDFSKIPFKESAVAKCASSPTITENCSKYSFGNLYKLCQVEIYICSLVFFSLPEYIL